MSIRVCLARLLSLGWLVGFSALAADWMPEPVTNLRIPEVKSLYEGKDYATALEELRKANSEAGSSEQEKLWLVLMEGALQAELGNSSKALDVFRRGLNSAPDASLPVSTEKAVDLFARARKVATEALFKQVSEDYENLRYDAALKALKKAERFPLEEEDRVRILLMRGILLAESNRPVEAQEAFLEAIDLAPEATLPLEASPRVMGMFKRASAELPDFRKNKRKFLMDAVLKACEERRYSDAVAAASRLQQRRGLSPQDLAWAHVMEGIAQFELGAMAEAERAFDRGLALDPEMALPIQASPEVRKPFEWARGKQLKRKWLAEAQEAFRAKQYSSALDALVKAEGTGALSDLEKPWVHVLKGQVLTELSREGDAMASFRAALLLDPEVRLITPASPEQQKLFERARHSLRHPLQSFAWMPLAGSVVSGIGGGVLLWQAWGVDQRLRRSDTSIVTVQQRRDTVQSGKTFQIVGWSLIGVGAAGLAAAAGMYFFDTGPADGRVTVIVSPQGAMAGMTWEMP